jgi:hypothetical protein
MPPRQTDIQRREAEEKLRREGRAAVQRYALARHEWEQLRARMDVAEATALHEQKAALDYIRENGPTTCSLNNDNRLVTIFTNGPSARTLRYVVTTPEDLAP